MEPKLFTLIGKVEHEDVMNVCLVVNDDLQKTFIRWHDLQDGKKPEPFVPGENLKATLLSPTHTYTSGDGAGEKEEEEEYYDEEVSSKPEPTRIAAPAKQVASQGQGQGQGGAQKAEEPIMDLFNFDVKPVAAAPNQA